MDESAEPISTLDGRQRWLHDSQLPGAGSGGLRLSERCVSGAKTRFCLQIGLASRVSRVLAAHRACRIPRRGYPKV
jgi:hypothetical protein